MKKWRCTVCGYIHTGDTPPEVCPECGVGPEFFELIGEVENPALSPEKKAAILPAIFKISYGLFVVTSVHEGKINGQICNTVFQVTSEPLIVALGVNKSTYTHELIQNSGIVGISTLGPEHVDLVRRFGYSSGRQMDKFAGVEFILGSTGAPLIKGAVAHLEGHIRSEQSVDLGTHTLYTMDVLDGKLLTDVDPLTYAQYRAIKKKA